MTGVRRGRCPPGMRKGTSQCPPRGSVRVPAAPEGTGASGGTRHPWDSALGPRNAQGVQGKGQRTGAAVVDCCRFQQPFKPHCRGFKWPFTQAPVKRVSPSPHRPRDTRTPRVFFLEV